MPLRIAHVANEAFGSDTANGVQHVVYCLAQAQADIGCAVAVFTRDDHAVHFFGSGPEAASRSPVPTRAGSVKSLRQRLLSRYLEKDVADSVVAWHPDVVHFHSVHIPQNVALAADLRRAGIPYCVTAHGGLFRAAWRRGRVKKSIFNLLFERRYLNEARFIQALSPQEAEVIRRHGVDRPVVVVPNGLPPGADLQPVRPDALYAERSWLRGRLVFMFIGRLEHWQKGLDLLVEAFARARLRDAALVLVGPDCRGSRAVLTALAKRRGILADVVFIESAFGQDRANLFAAADVFVHPSRWEGLSLSVLAAAAAGKACVVTREADPLGALERAQAAIVVEPTVSGIVEGLTRAATLSRDDLQAIGARGRDIVEENFCWPSIAATLVEAYRNALTKDGAG